MTDIRTVTNFKRRLDSAHNKVILLEFYAPWSKPCREIDELVRSLARKYAEKAIVLKINVDKFEELVLKYRVRRKPTFVFLKDNHSMGKVIGPDAKNLTNMIYKLCKTELGAKNGAGVDGLN